MENNKQPKYDIGDRFRAIDSEKWKTITAVYANPGQRIMYCLDGHYSDLLEERELDLGLKQKKIVYKSFH